MPIPKTLNLFFLVGGKFYKTKRAPNGMTFSIETITFNNLSLIDNKGFYILKRHVEVEHQANVPNAYQVDPDKIFTFISAGVRSEHVEKVFPTPLRTKFLTLCSNDITYSATVIIYGTLEKLTGAEFAYEIAAKNS